MSDDEEEVVIDLTLESDEKPQRVRRRSVRLHWYDDGENNKHDDFDCDHERDGQGHFGQSDENENDKIEERESELSLVLSDDLKNEARDTDARTDDDYDCDKGNDNDNDNVASDDEPAPSMSLPTRRKPRRTKEEIALEAAAKRQRREEEKKRRALLRAMGSEKHILRFLTVVLDPELVSTPLGLRIVESFQQTRQRPEHEHIQYRINSLGINPPLPAAIWTRRSLDFSDDEEPHVLVCFEPQQFVEHVINDRLEIVRSSLARRCPGYRVHMVVNGLDRYLTRMERADFAVAIKLKEKGGQAFQRQLIEEFVGSLLVHPESGAFYDVKSPQQGAAYVTSLTKAIAKKPIRPDDSRVILEAKTGKTAKSKSLNALLSIYPLEQENVAIKTCVYALCEIPAVGPQIAHALATEYGDLGSLMEMSSDPRRPLEAKIRELEQIIRTGHGTTMRVGPKAAAQVIQVLNALDPDAPVLELDDCPGG